MRRIFNRAVMPAIIVCLGIQTANAGLLGMPFNLRPAIELIDRDAATVAPSSSLPRYVDDVFTAPALVIEC